MADISKIKALNGTTYNIKDATARAVMSGANASTGGKSGAVPTPAAGDQNKLLQGNGVWTDRINIGRKANTVVAIRSTAEGFDTTASGYYSHAEGNNTISNHRSQHVFGEYNIYDRSEESAQYRGNYVEIVGNGTSDSSRSNARTLDWNGNEVLAGDLTFSGASGVSVKNRVLTPSAAIMIPDSSASYNLPGLTANHVVVAWRFSSSAENSPPCNLTVTTYDGYFTVVKSNGTTTETFQPVFAVPLEVTAMTHSE